MLASLRGLTAEGFAVTAVGASPLAPGLWSRDPAGRRLAPHPRLDLDGFLAVLTSLVREERFAILLAGTDASLLAISENRDRLSEHVRLGLPPHPVVAGALDRVRVARAAVAAGVPAPEERVCADVKTALAAGAELGYPVAVKPIETVIVRDGVTHRRASRIAHGARELERRAREIGPCVVQRWLQARVVSVGGVAAADGILAHAVSRYERMWPVHGGNVAFSETIAAPPGLLERVEALLRELGWTGLFELELLETADGRYAAIDFNPRAYGSMSLAIAAGVCLPAVWCDWLLDGRRPGQRAATPGLRYRWEDADLRHAASVARHGSVRNGLAALAPKRRVTHAYFQLRDPLPSVGRVLQMVAMTRDRARDRSRLADAGISPGSGTPQRSSAR